MYAAGTNDAARVYNSWTPTEEFPHRVHRLVDARSMVKRISIVLHDEVLPLRVSSQSPSPSNVDSSPLSPKVENLPFSELSSAAPPF